MNKFMHWLLYEEEFFGNVFLTSGFKILVVCIALWGFIHINWKDQLEQGLDAFRYYATYHATQKGIEEGC